jgi:hypothetical protein
MIVIRIVSDALGQRTHFDGLYVSKFDPDAHQGRGEVRASRELKDALTFESHESAHTFWKQSSKVQPWRPDGKPNRPLTAYNVILVQV